MFHNAAREWLRRLLTSGLWLWFSAGAFSQALVQEQTVPLNPVANASAYAAPATSVGSALRSLASRAAVAFTGRVVKMERTGDVLVVSFAVEDALVGNPGGLYTVREWAGLSPMGRSHYTLGQRVAIFLTAPGKSGLSSPVDGQEGIVPIVQESAEQAPVLDVRRLAAGVTRAMRQPMEAAETAAIALSDARALIARAPSAQVNTEGTVFRAALVEPKRQHLPGAVANSAPVQVGTMHRNLLFTQSSAGGAMHSAMRLGPVAQ